MLKKLSDRIINWQKSHVGHRTLLVMASIGVGVISAFAAIALKIFVHNLHRIPEYFFTSTGSRIWYILLPLTGILLTVFVVKIFFGGKLEKGLGSILFSITRKSSKISSDKMYSHVITSGITVGFGGSAGLEAPIVITGAAIGSNFASRFRFDYKERALLLACGAAAGIATVFNSPIAGVIFAIEVLLTDISIPLFIPLLISTASATIVSKLLYKGQLFYLITNDWYLHAIPFYVLLGITCGLLSVYMTRITLYVEGWMGMRKNVILKALGGGLILGLMIFLFPPLFGEGYVTIENLFRGAYYDLLKNSVFTEFLENPWFLVMITLVIVLIKAFATALTLGSGGNGGIFAPSLFTGALTGFGFAYSVNLSGISKLHVSNFIAVGMAGIMSGVIRAPLTAIFLIAEITGGYVLFVPLMIVSALSYFISRFFEPYSIYTKHLAQKGHLFTDDKDSNVLKQIHLDDLIETEFIPLLITDTFDQVIAAFTKSNRNIFPVIDKENNFLGIVELDQFKESLFQPEVHSELSVERMVQRDVLSIDVRENMDEVMRKLEDSKLWNIPVTKDSKYAGFISRSNILSFYRRILKQTSPMF
jgi:chloride channel protein, CIC family